MAVVTRLGQVSGVTNLVSTRVYQEHLPQKPTLPALRVQLISEPRTHHLRGVTGAVSSRVQVDAFVSDSVSDPYGSVRAIGDAILAALDGQVFTASGIAVSGAFCIDRRVMYEAADLRLWREVLDFTVWWRDT